MAFRVYDGEGNDVTDDRQWFINSDGQLFYLTDDIDSPLIEANDYWYGD